MRTRAVVGGALGLLLVLAGCTGGPEREVGPEPGIESVAGAVAAVEAGVAGWTPQDARFPVPDRDDLDRTVVAASVEVADGGTVLTVTFTGAEGASSEPCGADYTGYPVLGPMAVGLVVAEFDPPTDEMCSAVGYPRAVQIALPEPLGGRTVVGLDGTPVTVVGDEAPCTRSWTTALPADFAGAPDAQGALAAWLALDPSLSTAPEGGTPQEGWLPRDEGVQDRVVLVRGGFEATASRSTRGEWAVTAVGCTTSEPAQG